MSSLTSATKCQRNSKPILEGFDHRKTIAKPFWNLKAYEYEKVLTQIWHTSLAPAYITERSSLGWARYCLFYSCQDAQLLAVRLQGALNELAGWTEDWIYPTSECCCLTYKAQYASKRSSIGWRKGLPRMRQMMYMGFLLDIKLMFCSHIKKTTYKHTNSKCLRALERKRRRSKES